MINCGRVTGFYEKVVKVKADVAAILNFFSHSIRQGSAQESDGTQAGQCFGSDGFSVHSAVCETTN
jgi:hypothetical protein